jgi:hypothetical protein
MDEILMVGVADKSESCRMHALFHIFMLQDIIHVRLMNLDMTLLYVAPQNISSATIKGSWSYLHGTPYPPYYML